MFRVYTENMNQMIADLADMIPSDEQIRAMAAREELDD